MNKLLKTTSARPFFVFVLAVLLLAIGGCSSSSDEAETLKIAVSANLEPAVDSIAKVWEKKHGIRCEITSNATGMLANQIEQGAPFDVFISAKLAISEKLYRNSLSEKPVHFSNGSLLLVYHESIPAEDIKAILKHAKTQRISLADPKSAPYGEAALAYLKNEQLFESLESKIVYGESIEQVNHYLQSNAVDAAFTSNSFLQKVPKGFRSIPVPANTHPPIKQGISILSHGKKAHSEACEQFLAYFSTTESKAIMRHFGYGVLP